MPSLMGVVCILQEYPKQTQRGLSSAFDRQRKFCLRIMRVFYALRSRDLSYELHRVVQNQSVLVSNLENTNLLWPRPR